MTSHPPIDRATCPAETLERMAALYPQQAGLLHHSLPDHPLLSIEALAQLGEGLPASEVEYNPGNVPIGVRPEDVPSNGLSIGERIARKSVVEGQSVSVRVDLGGSRRHKKKN